MTIYDNRQDENVVRDLTGPHAEIIRILDRIPLKTSQFSAVLATAGAAISGCAMTLYLLNGERNVLQEVVSHDHTVNVFEQLHFGGGTGLAGWVMRQRRPLFLRGRNPENDGVREHHDTLLFVPLRDGHEPMGLLAASHPDPDGLDDETRAFLREVADLMAQALVRGNAVRRETAEAERRPEGVADDAVTAARALARRAVDEITRALATITGNARMIELDAPQLPPAVAGRLQAVIEEARQITLISHKLSRLDRLLAGETEEPACRRENTPSRPMGDESC